MAGVNANVLVADPVTGDRVFIEKGQEPPKAVRHLLGDHLFDGTDKGGQDSEPAASVEVPPRSGRGSGRDAWATYAEAKGVAVADDDGRDEIISNLEAAGVPVE